MNTKIWDHFIQSLKDSMNDMAFAYVEDMVLMRMSDTQWDVSLSDMAKFNYVQSFLSERISEVLQKVLEEEKIEGHIELNYHLAGAQLQNQNRSVSGMLPFNDGYGVRDSSAIVEEKAAFVASPRRVLSENSAEPFIASVELRKASNLTERFSFENFVLGNSNDVAYAAAKAVAANPGSGDCNPLFIYGGVGLGKTHLMQAIGNEIIETSPLRVRYMTSEDFANDYIDAIQAKSVPSWRARMRDSYDVLLIDDIQFIAGKVETQKEFFNTFNYLVSANKQIVLTSDKHPSEIAELEERMRSRFGGGGTFDIQLPDYETRMAILNKKARADGVYLPNDVAAYIASKVATNVRDLEGCLNRIMTTARVRGGITLELAQRIIDPIYQTRNVMVGVDAVINCVCKYFGISSEEILGKSRAKPFAYPRQIAMYLARSHTTLSYPDLGRAFGKDHTTVLHGVQRIMDDLAKKDQSLQNDIKRLEDQLLK